jgi:hypothetical protein
VYSYTRRLYRTAAVGTRKSELLFEDPVGLSTSWWPDGAVLAYTRMDSSQRQDIFMPLGPGTPSKPYPWLARPSPRGACQNSHQTGIGLRITPISPGG